MKKNIKKCDEIKNYEYCAKMFEKILIGCAPLVALNRVSGMSYNMFIL